MKRLLLALIGRGNLLPAEPLDWRVQKAEGATASVSQVDAPGRSGRHALLLKGTGQWMSANSPQVQVDPARTYRASAWIRARIGHAYVQIDYWAEGRWLGAGRGAQRIVTDEWQEVKVESDPRRLPQATHFSVGIVSDGPAVEVYAEDVRLIRQ